VDVRPGEVRKLGKAATNDAAQRFLWMLPSATNDPHEGGPIKTWVLMHLFRTWTALVTLIAFGLSFLYKPEADLVAAHHNDGH
jgi:hypothetical protein